MKKLPANIFTTAVCRFIISVSQVVVVGKSLLKSVETAANYISFMLTCGESLIDCECTLVDDWSNCIMIFDRVYSVRRLLRQIKWTTLKQETLRYVLQCSLIAPL